jgi:TPR repeat
MERSHQPLFHQEAEMLQLSFLDLIKVIAPGVVVAVSAYFLWRQQVKYQASKVENDLWSSQKQSHWSPLLRATRELKNRFEFLSRIYKRQLGHESLTLDFCELYILRRDKINDDLDPVFDPNAPRKNENSVQNIRTRVCHELTFAESSLYITVKYLGNAEHVWRDMYEQRLILPNDARSEMMGLISNVRESLQGIAGNGIFTEQQEYIGETVWSTAGGIITNLEFRKRLFDLPGWEQFANLLRFFVQFEPKVKYEVAHAILALGLLENKVDKLCSCQSKKKYEALWHRYRRSRILNRELAEAYYNRGKAQEDRKDLAGAIAAYTQALKFNSQDGTTYYNRGLVYTQQGDKAQAIADFKCVLDVSNDDTLRQSAEGKLKTLGIKD